MGVSIQSVGDAANEILNSFANLESEFGRTWIENAWPNVSGIVLIAILVEFDKCLRIADVIERGNVLKRKLLAGFQSTETQRAMTEAQVAIRLVSSGAKVEYEPQIPKESKKPDLLAIWDNMQVAFEVTKLELSAENAEQWRKCQASMANACGNILEGGSLDIYITNTIITQDMVKLVLKAVKDLVCLDRSTDYFERQISETIYLAYDPTGSVRKDRTNAPAPTKSATVEECIEDVNDDRSKYIMEKLGILLPMSAIGHVGIHTLPDGYKIPTIVRVYRVASDFRIMSKAIAKAVQLPSNILGVVVIDMSNTTARPNYWAAEIHRMFGHRLYTRMSAVWLRSGVIKDASYKWTEYLVTNPYATMGLENAIVERILPSGQDVYLNNESAL